jgi:molecular chaperone GrpE (heat shock protein)
VSHKRLVWQEISELAARLTRQDAPDGASLSELGQQLSKLGKVQFKANTLLEAQVEQQKEALSALQKSVARQDELLAGLAGRQQEAIEATRRDMVLAMLPVLDGLDAALENGQRQIPRLQAADAQATLAAWLDGLRLARDRMLEVLAQAQIEPIPAVGHAFDPHLHVAAGVDTSGAAPAGTIVAEDRRGYRSPAGVLRYAEVIVSRPTGVNSNSENSNPQKDS